MFYDDEMLTILRPPPMVRLACPACQHAVYGLSEAHARDLLAIHRDGTCQRGGET